MKQFFPKFVNAVNQSLGVNILNQMIQSQQNNQQELVTRLDNYINRVNHDTNTNYI